MQENKKSRGTVHRLMGYIAKQHRKQFTTVIISVLVSVCAGLAGSMLDRKSVV